MTLKNIYDCLKVSVLLVPLLLYSCQKDDSLNEEPASDEVEFAFTLPEPAETPSSRAVIGDDGRGTFEEGDRISLYVGDGPAGHHILTLRNGSWTPRLTRQELGSGLVTLNACYPADEVAEDEVVSRMFRLSADQSGEGYASSDILWVHKTVNMDNLSGGRIELPFRHGLHRLRLTLRSESGGLPSDLNVAIRGASGGTFSFFLGQVEADGSEAVWITPKAAEGETGSFRAVLVPQPLKELQTGNGWIRITANGKTAYYRAPDKIGGSANLEPGKESVLTLYLKTDGDVEPEPDPIPGDWANSKHWVYGIKSPVCNPDEVVTCFPDLESFPTGKWFKAGEYSPEYLNWSPECGWYDCDKRNMFGNNTGFIEDGNLCWAAAASNLLHWWMHHNRAYIDAYDRKYGTDLYPDFPRPSMEFTGTEESGIFDLFRENFANLGNWDYAAVDWFLNGTVGRLYPNDSDIETKFQGYFKEVFAGVSVATLNQMLTKEDFNRTVKDALSRRQALGFVRLAMPDRDYHDMVIWGAEFDEAGDVSAIYYVDNNDYYNFEGTGSDNNYQHHRMIRTPIWYNDDMWPVHMGTGKSTFIITLTMVDLGRDIWQKAFPEVRAEDE